MVIMDAGTLEPLPLIRLTDAGTIMATPFANIFVVALAQAGQVWIIDLDRRGLPITAITDVGRHLHGGFRSPDGAATWWCLPTTTTRTR